MRTRRQIIESMTAKVDIKGTQNTERWKDWSFSSHTTEEIREKLLTAPEDVCFCYLNETNTYDPDFATELIALSTRLLDKTNYPQDVPVILEHIKKNVNGRSHGTCKLKGKIVECATIKPCIEIAEMRFNGEEPDLSEYMGIASINKKIRIDYRGAVADVC